MSNEKRLDDQHVEENPKKSGSLFPPSTFNRAKVVSSSVDNQKTSDEDKIGSYSNTAAFLIKKKQLFEAYENLEEQKQLYKE